MLYGYHIGLAIMINVFTSGRRMKSLGVIKITCRDFNSLRETQTTECSIICNQHSN